MLLKTETYRRFGYWPRDLKPKSTKRVVHKCDKCKRRKTIQYGDYTKKITELCIKCSSLACLEKACKANTLRIRKKKEAQHKQAKKAQKVEIPIEKLADLYARASIAPRKCDIYRISVGNGASNNATLYSIADSYSIFKVLGRVPKDTQEFKAALKESLLKFTFLERSEIIKPMIFKKRLPSCDAKCFTTNLNYKKWGFLFECDGVEITQTEKMYEQYKGRHNELIVITKASFFVDDKWIYIG